MGSNCEDIQQGQCRFQVWDLSGADSMRGAWAAYCQGTHAVVYVIDASDENPQKMQQSKTELM
jgi:ADP-ribosylation factor-like protein 1